MATEPLNYLRRNLFKFTEIRIDCRLARYAVESYLEQILRHGFFHADPVSLFCVVLNA